MIEWLLKDMMDAREKHPELSSKIVDLTFNELIQDPMIAVNRIYASLNLNLSEKAVHNMKAYLNGEAGDGDGKRKPMNSPLYRPEWFGFDSERIHSNTVMRYINLYNLSTKFKHSSEY